MSFRKYGGTTFSARNNIVSSNYNNSNNLYVSNAVGQQNSYISFLSDISANIISSTTTTLKQAKAFVMPLADTDQLTGNNTKEYKQQDTEEQENQIEKKAEEPENQTDTEEQDEKYDQLLTELKELKKRVDLLENVIQLY